MKVYHNGTILTMNDQQKVVEAVAVSDGKIIATGKMSDMSKGAEYIDLKGKTLMPSFIDPHSHFTGFANSLTHCDLSSATSYHDIVKLMKSFKKKRDVKDGDWIIGSNYDHNYLEEKEHPTKKVLDEISEVNPIIITHSSNHMGVINSFAMKQEGLDDNIEDPQGGHYGRYDNQELNGYLEENAFLSFQGEAIKLDVNQLKSAFMEAQDIYASYGITTVQEGMVSEGLLNFLEYIADEDMLKLDLIGYLDLANFKEYKNIPYLHNYYHNLKIGGYKIFLDGSPQGRTAWMKTPYSNSDDYGYPIHTDEEVYNLIEEALTEEVQVLAHCNGDAAADQYVAQFERVVKDLDVKDTLRPVMIHAQTVLPHELKRMRSLDMIPSFFVAHTYYWGDIHIQNFGKERAEMISPVREAINNGLVYTLHQDSPVILPDMMKTVWCAVNRRTKSGVSIGVDQCLSVEEALKGVTINAAYQYFEEDFKGSIEVGKHANMIILDKNPLIVEKEDLDTIKVMQTIKDGDIIFKRD